MSEAKPDLATRAAKGRFSNVAAAVKRTSGGEPPFAAVCTKVSYAQIVNFANPAFQWPQPGNLAAMQQPQAALRRACSYQ